MVNGMEIIDQVLKRQTDLSILSRSSDPARLLATSASIRGQAGQTKKRRGLMLSLIAWFAAVRLPYQAARQGIALD